MEIENKKLVSLIKSCSKLGVKKVSVNGTNVDIEFFENGAQSTIKLSKAEVELSKAAASSEFDQNRGLELATMDIEDPYQYEQMLLSNEEKDFLDADLEHIGT